MSETLPSSAGWYTDPYEPGMIRWFDGSKWTTHAVPASTSDPDAVVVADFDSITPEQAWLDKFPKWDIAIPKGTERRFDGRGGVGGLEGTYIARGVGRYGNSRNAGLVMSAALTVLLGFAAWADPEHPIWVVALASAGLLITIGTISLRIYSAHHWKRVGESTDEHFHPQ